jgi:hypothetical protein
VARCAQGTLHARDQPPASRDPHARRALQAEYDKKVQEHQLLLARECRLEEEERRLECAPVPLARRRGASSTRAVCAATA